MKTITMADVAQHAGVSKSTVSQYVNQRYDYMGEKTKERVEKAIAELGYSPNIIARSLKQKSTTTIGVIVANILHVFSTQVIRAIEDFCNEANFHIIVCNADDDPIKEKKYMDMLRAKQVDGIIVFPTGGNLALYQQLVRDNYPIVFVDRMVPEVEVNTVLLDNEKAVRMGVNLLVEKGYQRIGMVTPPLEESVTPRLERVSGFKQALKANNQNFDPNLLVSEEIENIRIKLDELLQQPQRPDAILAVNDRVLFEILHYIKEKKLSIPDDLGVIGIDDVTFASFYSPTLTTIAQPAFEMGKKAAELLLNRIQNKTQEIETKIYRFKPLLMQRDSC
ncbi:LacI family DNA-binding transcriptional regulator [Oceanobacillus jordanicus]|uniref:Substrate-binding domain-containing protein n=1 Tax=Oceanobacillus jordanicus TaxID=2867266 RepID=A0AAW5B4T0_9BACI|nr:substrate-binding domain-containing protein [Oceanobacillus jordanicus]MCG3419500.1 substrate-binding domain-containing protein [Oceanobacillus jordanicus]